MAGAGEGALAALEGSLASLPPSPCDEAAPPLPALAEDPTEAEAPPPPVPARPSSLAAPGFSPVVPLVLAVALAVLVREGALDE